MMSKNNLKKRINEAKPMDWEKFLHQDEHLF